LKIQKISEPVSCNNSQQKKSTPNYKAKEHNFFHKKSLNIEPNKFQFLCKFLCSTHCFIISCCLRREKRTAKKYIEIFGNKRKESFLICNTCFSNVFTMILFTHFQQLKNMEKILYTCFSVGWDIEWVVELLWVDVQLLVENRWI
jgi:hypothetical protein